MSPPNLNVLEWGCRRDVTGKASPNLRVMAVSIDNGDRGEQEVKR